MTALKIAGELDDDNVLRQKTEKAILSEAEIKIEKNGYAHNRVIVIDGENWHMGVMGIVAARLCEKYLKPVIVLSVDGDMAHGSGRSYEGFGLYDAINACRDVLEKYGGHALAAGVSLKSENIGEFRERINAYALKTDYVPPVLTLDLKLNPAAMSIDMAYAVKSLEPFGPGNPVPLFGIYGVRIQGISELSGGKHLKLMLNKDQTVFAALLFSVSRDNFCYFEGDVCDIAVCLDINAYKGNNMLSVQIKAIRFSGAYGDEVFSQASAFDDFVSGYSLERETLCPSREDIALVYRSIAASPVSEKRLEYLFMDKPGYAKTKTAIMILSELGFISLDGGIYSVASHEKRELAESGVYRKLKGGD